MRKGVVVALAVLASVFLAASVMAESGVKEECVTMCKAAAAFLNEKGFYPTVFEINKKDGKFVSKNTYVFLVDLEGHLLAHPFNQQYIGMDMTPNKDANGVLFVQDYIKVAKSSKGEGWTEYMYPHPRN
jgi:ABC-type anion transport system duplicated permease subunit